jgi:hypothetical protein
MINLTYDLQTAHVKHGVTQHAQKEMSRLGITYRYAVPQSMFDCWHFWDCRNIPDKLPPYIEYINVAPQEMVGHGLSQTMADELI